MNQPLEVVHVITRMIVGGAQENTMLSCELADAGRFRSLLVTGPQTGSEGELLGESAARGVALVMAPHLVREVAPVSDLRAFVGLVRLLRAQRPDVIHTHSSKAGILGRAAARSTRPRAVVHTVHGWSFHDEMTPTLRRLWVLLERVAATWCDRLVVVTERDREKGLAERIGRPEQYVLIRSGFELEPFRAARADRAAIRLELGVPPDAPVVGTVLRLSPQKDPLTLVAASALLVREDPTLHVVVVGDGGLRTEVEHAIARSTAPERIHLLGLRRDVPHLMAAFDVFLLTSLWEGLPKVVLQAMAASVPVVSTCADGVAEVVDDGVTGLLVPKRDPEAAARAVQRVLDDPALGDRLSTAALELVQEFDVSEMVSRLETLYEALARHPREA